MKVYSLVIGLDLTSALTSTKLLPAEERAALKAATATSLWAGYVLREKSTTPLNASAKASVIFIVYAACILVYKVEVFGAKRKG